jgi:hypothetical protein
MNNVSRFVRHGCAIAAIGMAISVPASAGRDEVRDDPAVVEDRLHHMGFIEWRRLKWAHGYWKIDDARRENGHVYDLKLEAGTFDLVKLVREKH